MTVWHRFIFGVLRPKSSILHARVHIAGVMRERLFTSAHGTLEGPESHKKSSFVNELVKG